MKIIFRSSLVVAKIIMASALLSGCVTQSAPVLPAAVPGDILACNKLQLGAVPERSLTEAEVEAGWKQDRYLALEKARCLNRLIVRDQALSRQSGR